MGGLKQAIVTGFSREEKKNADRQGCGQESKRGKEKRKKKKQGHPPTSCGSSMSTMRGALTIDKVIGRK
jgi:hypothetical protein